MNHFGHRVAQAGAVLMIAGGAVDMALRTLLPHHAALLSAEPGVVSDTASALVLALLHALGGALIAAGVAILVLLHLGRIHRSRTPYLAAAATAAIAEGPNAFGIFRSGSNLFVAPLLFMLLIVTGSVVCILTLASRTAASSGHARSTTML